MPASVSKCFASSAEIATTAFARCSASLLEAHARAHLCLRHEALRALLLVGKLLEEVALHVVLIEHHAT